MKKLTGILLILAAACSPELLVQSDYDRDVNLRQYTTYNWAIAKDIEASNNPLYYNELNDKRIKKAVNLQMQNCGFTLGEENPDLLVHYHIVVENKTTVRTDPYGYYGPYWTRSNVLQYEYDEGTLIIDLMDAQNKNLVWRGWAVSVLDNSKMIPEELVRIAVEKIFEKYPVR